MAVRKRVSRLFDVARTGPWSVKVAHNFDVYKARRSNRSHFIWYATYRVSSFVFAVWMREFCWVTTGCLSINISSAFVYGKMFISTEHCAAWAAVSWWMLLSVLLFHNVSTYVKTIQNRIPTEQSGQFPIVFYGPSIRSKEWAFIFTKINFCRRIQVTNPRDITIVQRDCAHSLISKRERQAPQPPELATSVKNRWLWTSEEVSSEEPQGQKR